jgi:hypothetical protein
MKNILLLFFGFSGLCISGQSLTVNPNPFAQRTQVCYTLTTADTITIAIFNRWGQEIVVIASNSITPAGVYCDSLIMDSFEDNVYFLSFRSRQKNFLAKQVIKSISASINEINNEEVVIIYPNPVKDMLTLKISNSFKNKKLTLSNVSGETIKIFEIALDKNVDLSGLSNGIYFLKVEGLISSYKIIKIN